MQVIEANLDENGPATKPFLDDMMKQMNEISAKHEEALVQLIDRMDALMNETRMRLEFARKLELFFGPILAGKTPPLDDATIADKTFVTNAVARIARTLRAEMGELADLVRALGHTRPPRLPIVLAGPRTKAKKPAKKKVAKSSTGKRRR